MHIKASETQDRNDAVYIRYIYNYFINYAQNIYLTKVYANAVADKYFPSFDENNYNQTLLGENKENNLEYKHILYRRKNER